MRPGVIAVISLVSAVVGAVVVLLIGTATGIVDTDGTETVFLPSDTPDLTFDGASRDQPAARPLSGNGFDPARIYGARSAGVVTIHALLRRPPRRAGSHRAQGSSSRRRESS